ncbi:hypothetical protein WI460_14670 [Gemmatimonadota bacterium Y43]|uniref:hypothetical protein n=1 Tax=Gaopeijia maritima TaxID=3119007 RepID=UPI003291D90D
MSDSDAGRELFWSVAQPHLEAGVLVRGTIMGRPCVRTADGEFVAVPHSGTGRLVVRLPEDRVAALSAEGVGEPWGPGARVFKGWMAVHGSDPAVWSSVIAEALAAAE